MPIIFIGGGSRSGKSTYALTRAVTIGGRLGFIATAQAHDEEMRNVSPGIRQIVPLSSSPERSR